MASGPALELVRVAPITWKLFMHEPLTPDEFHDYELRTSIPASQLLEVLKEMEPTEQEFRTIFESWNALNAHQPGSTEYREAQQSSEATLKTFLGPSRFELYLKGVKMLGYSK